MPLTVRTRQSGGVSILDLNGKITLGDGTTALREQLTSLLAAGRKNILINLADVSYVDSAGLGEIVRTYTTAANQGGAIKLLHLQSKLKSLLRMTNLNAIFPVFDDEAAAVASFSQQASA